MFSWRQNSQQIFNKILTSQSLDDSESDSDSDTDDDLSTSCSVMGSPVSPTRKYTGECYDEEIEKKLQLWIDLTNIRMGPFANPTRMKLAEQKLQRPNCFRSFSEGYTTSKMTYVSPDDNTLTVKFQYLIISERLKVTVTKANNLSIPEPTSNSVTEFQTRIGLLPSKQHTQDTVVVKGNRNPEFNSVVYFRGISLQEMHQRTLKFTVFCKEGNKKRFDSIGEVAISLENFDLTSETTLTENMDTRIRHTRGSSSKFPR